MSHRTGNTGVKIATAEAVTNLDVSASARARIVSCPSVGIYLVVTAKIRPPVLSVIYTLDGHNLRFIKLLKS
ncbi:hypothetical protein [Microcystis aeruginosa]|uniref:hypothetical protein n=1 Tax=Microcystis aeruginosa TaxID=1126 RepID=UPI00138F248E|nr:hypothetical protein [Microcystis aeruginosa]